MIFQILLLFLVASSSLASGISKEFTAIWWNVGGGNYFGNRVNYENCYADEGRNLQLLQKNIISLAEKNSPDVIILGEMYEGFLSEATLKKLSLTHPYSYRFLYNTVDHRALQVAVFAKNTPVEVKYLLEELHWSRDHASERSNNTSYLRSYQRISFQHDGKLVHVVPVHAVDPWPEMRRKTNLFETGLNLLFSRKNPSYIQAGYLQKAIAQDVPESSLQEQDSSLLLVGDFNIPQKTLGVVPTTYAKLKAGREVIPLIGKTSYTFPSAKCLHYKTLPKLQIDHAFLNGNVRGSGKILGHLGSDHFPIEVSITHPQTSDAR